MNVLTLVPNGMLCRAVVGLKERSPDQAELRQMGRFLEMGLEEGAIGFSVGLEYPVESSCTTAHIVELCNIAARYDGLFAPHLRNKDIMGLEAIEEGLHIAASSGVRLHIPHLVQRPGGPHDANAKAFALIDKMTPYDLWGEIVEQKNTALAIMVGAMSIGVCIIIAAAVH